MSQQEEFVFENWQQAAQQVKEQATKVQQAEQQIPDDQKQRQQNELKPQQAKQSLKQKIKVYSDMTLQEIETKYGQTNQNGTSKKSIKLGVGRVFKTDKDFAAFAEQIAQKLNEQVAQDQTLDEDSIVTFFQELTMFLYNGLEWENFFEILKKIKVLKNQRKNDQKKIQKQKLRKQNKKQEQQIKLSSKITQPSAKQTDNLFGEASNMTSLQQQQQRKKKKAQKKAEQDKEQQKVTAKEQKKQETVTPPPPPAANDDDDDFM